MVRTNSQNNEEEAPVRKGGGVPVLRLNLSSSETNLITGVYFIDNECRTRLRRCNISYVASCNSWRWSSSAALHLKSHKIPRLELSRELLCIIVFGRTGSFDKFVEPLEIVNGFEQY